MPELHLLNPLANSCGGSEWRTISLFKVLADSGPVTIWTLGPPDPRLYGTVPLRISEPRRGVFPRSGSLVIVGAYFQLPEWVRAFANQRVILLYNIPDQNHLRYALETLRNLGIDRPEIVAASNALAQDLADQGLQCSRVEYSWIDIDAFQPVAPRASREFSVGRMSRDVPEKFHSGDPALYRRLAELGFRIRVMGGTCLEAEVGEHPNIELLPEGHEPAPEFLWTLDAMLYRTSDRWFEAFGRSIVEAMASGVVPVAYARGGYADVIRHGVDGVLYKTEEEAVKWLVRLREEPDLRQSMAHAARMSMESLYGQEAREKLADYYFNQAARE